MERRRHKINLEFKDVSLYSDEVSNIETRDNCQTTFQIGEVQYKVPIIASPMKDVIDDKMASALLYLGAPVIHHRFQSVEEQITNYTKKGVYQSNPKLAGCAVGINDDEFTRLSRLYHTGCRLFCIDVALGASTKVAKFIDRVYHSFSDVGLIVGNVCSGKQFKWLASLPNVVGVRVGVGGGSACTTTNATGVYTAPITLIQECVAARIDNSVAIIMDGGIKEPSDYCKAIAFGADAVMIGGLIANTMESPAKKVVNDKESYTIYNGSASFENQQLYKTVPKYIEGQTKKIPYRGATIFDVINQFQNGLRSSMSYMNAHSLTEYRKNMKYRINK